MDRRILVGIDWGNTEHRVCAIDAAGAVLDERAFKHARTGLDELVAWLAAMASDGSAEILVGVERADGPLVETLLERRVRVFCINPLQTDRFRDRLSPAGAKDDRRDAYVLADALRTDEHRLREVQPTSARHLMLRELSRMGEEIQVERQRTANRLRAQLKRYFLQALELTNDPCEAWFLALLLRVHSPEIAQQDVSRFVASLLRRHQIRRTTASEVLDVLRQPSVTVLPGTVEAASRHVRQLARQLQLLNEQYREIQHDLEQALKRYGEDDQPGQEAEQRDAAILLTLPGMGRITVGTLLAEAIEAIRCRDYQRLRKQSGVAPVTQKSGRSHRVGMRLGCNHRLRRALSIAASVAIQHDARLREVYDRQRPKSGPRATYGRALRAVTDRLLEMAIACLRDGKPYDPSRRQARAETIAA